MASCLATRRHVDAHAPAFDELALLEHNLRETKQRQGLEQTLRFPQKGSSSVSMVPKGAVASRCAVRTTSLPRLGASSSERAAASRASAWREDSWVAQARPLPQKVGLASSSATSAGELDKLDKLEQLHPSQSREQRRGKPRHLQLLQPLQRTRSPSQSRPKSGQPEEASSTGSSSTERFLRKPRTASPGKTRAGTPISPKLEKSAPTSPLPAGYTKKERGDLDRFGDELVMPEPNFNMVEAHLKKLKKTDPDGLLAVIRQHLGVPKHGLAALHKAARAGAATTMKAFLAAGEDVNLASGLGWTALHYACDNGQSDMVKMLLERGADVSRPTLGGTTALHLACQGDEAACVLALLQYAPGYVMVDQEDNTRNTAVKMTKSPIVRWLLDYYKDFPSIRHRDDGTWDAENMLACLSREQNAQFGAALHSLLVGDCPGCASALALASAWPRMPMTIVTQTRSFLPSCPGPNGCRRASSMPRLA